MDHSARTGPAVNFRLARAARGVAVTGDWSELLATTPPVFERWHSVKVRGVCGCWRV